MSQRDVENLYKMLAELKEMFKEHSDRLDQHIKKSDDHIDNDEKWKKQMEPLLDRVTELTNVGDGIKTINNASKFWGWLRATGVVTFLIGAWAFIRLIK